MSKILLLSRFFININPKQLKGLELYLKIWPVAALYPVGMSTPPPASTKIGDRGQRSRSHPNKAHFYEGGYKGVKFLGIVPYIKSIFLYLYSVKNRDMKLGYFICVLWILYYCANTHTSPNLYLNVLLSYQFIIE